jgi:hypothetical protein
MINKSRSFAIEYYLQLIRIMKSKRSFVHVQIVLT